MKNKQTTKHLVNNSDIRHIHIHECLPPPPPKFFLYTCNFLITSKLTFRNLPQ